MIDLDTALMTLSQVRPIFHSEADFQHALAWQIHTQDPHARVRLEYRPLPREAMHLDIWAQGRDDALAIELKYLTEPLVIQHNGERFSLTNHSAQDQRRYDFVSDIVRLEHVVETLSLSNVTGYAVLLTNHGGYWATPSPYWTSAIDTAFRTHEGACLRGVLRRAAHASPGTMKGREEPLSVRGAYPLTWREYSSVTGQHQYGLFRYLSVRVDRETIGGVGAEQDSQAQPVAE